MPALELPMTNSAPSFGMKFARCIFSQTPDGAEDVVPKGNEGLPHVETGKALALEDKDFLSRPGQGGAGGAAAGAAADDDCVVRHHCCLGLANGENARMQCKGIRARRDEGRIPGERMGRARESPGGSRLPGAAPTAGSPRS